MSLAYAHMNKKKQTQNTAEPYARSALELNPHWYYFRDILFPQILAVKEKAK